ncbi:MAG: TlpA family protein disulfide reductase [Bacteroidales bacterium]|nr:TlpA family protein disulfide reductase [Bacteroidales bacterium]
MIILPSNYLKSQEIVTSRQLISNYTVENDTTYLLHFWATWCAPCIKELPEIDSVARQLRNSKFKLVLVSLDFENTLEKRLVPFMKKNSLPYDLLVLKQERGYQWLEVIDSEWSGAIPASMVIKNTKHDFYEQSFNYNELRHLLSEKYLLR